MVKTKKGSRLLGRLGKKIIHWYRNLTTFDKRVLWIFLGLFVLISLAMCVSNMWISYYDKPSSSECVDMGVATALKLASYTWWQILLIKWVGVVVVAIAISWILHGVQLRLLG